MLQTLYDRHVCPRLIHYVCSRTPFPKQREQLIPKARGRVLEIGLGSGLNLPYYDPSKVEHVFAVEPDESLANQAQSVADAQPLPVTIVHRPADPLPFEDQTFDTIVSTYTLCSIDDLASVFRQLRRVMKPDGKFLFAEHGRAPEPNLQRWQRRLNPLQRRIGGGCQLDKDIPKELEDGGFRLRESHQRYLPGLRILSYHYWGEATLLP